MGALIILTSPFLDSYLTIKIVNQSYCRALFKAAEWRDDMNKKSLLGLLLFSCVVISGMFLSTEVLIEQSSNTLHTQQAGVNHTEEKALSNQSTDFAKNEVNNTKGQSESSEVTITIAPNKQIQKDKSTVEETETNNKVELGEAAREYAYEKPTDINYNASISSQKTDQQITPAPSGVQDEKTTDGTIYNSSNASIMATADSIYKPQLIYDYRKVDYRSHIPKMVWDSELRKALDIKNPDIDLKADAAILLDVKTKKVLYYKNPVKAEFPASTAKLLTSIVALKNCNIKDIVTVGDEITMIASDSTRAYLKKGEKLTVENLLEGMLLPSGNDAAYAIAAYVGRKSLNNPEASKEEAIGEFRHLMNEEAKRLGAKNSYFMTPDGYDAIGQYTTAYDMGLIGMSAINYNTILDIVKKSKCSSKFPSGEEVTWTSTNKLLNRNSGKYYPSAFGLKTGTSTMAGNCLIAAAKKDGKKVICVIMHSDAGNRYDDAIKLMNYGLNQ